MKNHLTPHIDAIYTIVLFFVKDKKETNKLVETIFVENYESSIGKSTDECLKALLTSTVEHLSVYRAKVKLAHFKRSSYTTFANPPLFSMSLYEGIILLLKTTFHYSSKDLSKLLGLPRVYINELFLSAKGQFYSHTEKIYAIYGMPVTTKQLSD